MPHALILSTIAAQPLYSMKQHALKVIGRVKKDWRLLLKNKIACSQPASLVLRKIASILQEPLHFVVFSKVEN
jgi:hypothetical protein